MTFSTNEWRNRITMSPDDPNRKRRPVNRSGNAPDPKQQPITIAELHPTDGSHWWLTLLRTRMDGTTANDAADWVNLKLHVQGRALHKANFWVAWNSSQRRLNARLDTRAMQTLRPDLMSGMTALLNFLTVRDEWAAVPSHSLWVATQAGGGWEIHDDTIYDALTMCGCNKQERLFSDSDRPRLKQLAALIMAEQGHKGWNTVPDPLGFFTLSVKP